jgi:hypothetical protein
VHFVEEKLLALSLCLRLLLFLLLHVLLLGVLLDFGLRHSNFGLLADFGEQLLLTQRLLLACELDLEVDLTDSGGLGFDGGVVERVPEFLFDLLLLERYALAALDGIHIDGYFGDAVGEDGAVVGEDDEQAGVVFEVAGVGQFGWVLAGLGHLDLVGELQFGLVVAVAQDVDFVVGVEEGCGGGEGQVAVSGLGLGDVGHSPSC